MSFDDPTALIVRGTLPVFPLPNAVMFPEQQLPLHIFEPRYRQMVRDALDGLPFLVVAMLEETDAGIAVPRFAKVATAGRITAHQRLADGRFNILVEGTTRVALEEVPSEQQYRRVKCTPLPEPEDALDVPEQDRAAMLSVLGMVMQLARKQTPTAEFKSQGDIDAARLAFRITDRVVTDPGWRQRVLEAPTAKVRVRATTEALASLLSELPTTSGSRGMS